MQFLINRFITSLLALPLLFTVNFLIVVYLMILLSGGGFDQQTMQILSLAVLFGFLAAMPAASIQALLIEYYFKKDSQTMTSSQSWQAFGSATLLLIISEVSLLPMITEANIPRLILAGLVAVSALAPASLTTWIVTQSPMEKDLTGSYYKMTRSLLLVLACLILIFFLA